MKISKPPRRDPTASELFAFVAVAAIVAVELVLLVCIVIEKIGVNYE